MSFGGNVVFGIGGGLIGQSVRCQKEAKEENCDERGFFIGAVVGALIASILDVAILGWEDMLFDDVAVRRPASAGFAVAPSWSLGPRGSFALGLSGRF